MIDLNTKMLTKKIMVTLVFEINVNSIYTTIILINPDIIVLFQIIILEFKIEYFKIIIFLLVCCLINIIIKDEYS